MIEISIEVATGSEIDQITEVWEQELAPTYHRPLLPDSREKFISWLKHLQSSDKGMTLLARIDSAVIGYCLGEISQETTGNVGYIHHIAVLSDFQRKGVATKLMDEIEKRLSPNVIGFAVSISVVNASALHFFKTRAYKLTYYWYEKERESYE